MRSRFLQAAKCGLLSSGHKISASRKLSTSCAFAALTLLSSCGVTESWNLNSILSEGATTTRNSILEAACSSPTFAENSSRPMSTSSSSATTFEVAQFPCRSDNYGYLIHDPTTGETAAIDTPSASEYEKELDQRGWKLTHILNTHRHHDHVGGNLELKKDGVKIYGPGNERDVIPGIDQVVKPGDSVQVGNFKAEVIDVGGHTVGHIAFYFPEQSAVFVGDSLFALGCGRMFEGTPSQFWSSLQRLRDLPDDTVVYCAHEYTESNAKFAMSVEPNNQDLVAKVAIVKSKRSRGEPTVPTLLGEEKKMNPFLRVDFSDEIRKNIGVTANDSDSVAFGKLRKAKDNF